MNGDRTVDILFLLMAITLPLSALIARRLPIGTVAKMAVAWIAIFGLGLILVGQRETFGRLWDGGRRALFGEDQSVVGSTVRIEMAPDGHFWASARINGVSQRLLIDSGATVSALSKSTAQASGVQTDSASFPVMLNTANGTVSAERAYVGTLEVGGIIARDLPVAVSPAFGDTNVLGMNFLSRLRSWRVEGRTLVLEPVTAL